MSQDDDADLGFRHRRRKSGEVEVLHHGRLAATLRGPDAADFLAELLRCSDAEQQQLMARLTGNFKRVNERTAAGHQRNRR